MQFLLIKPGWILFSRDSARILYSTNHQIRGMKFLSKKRQFICMLNWKCLRPADDLNLNWWIDHFSISSWHQRRRLLMNILIFSVPTAQINIHIGRKEQKGAEGTTSLWVVPSAHTRTQPSDLILHIIRRRSKHCKTNTSQDLLNIHDSGGGGWEKSGLVKCRAAWCAQHTHEIFRTGRRTARNWKTRLPR